MGYDRRRFLQAAAIAAVGAAAGCSAAPGDTTTRADGDGDGGSTPAATPTSGSSDRASGGNFDYGGWFSETSNYDGTTKDMRGQREVTVDVGAPGNGENFAFAPPAIWVDPGTTVAWEWTGKGGAHNVVAKSGADFRSGDPTEESGTTFSRTFESAGMVKYFCSPHESLGMRGAVVVGNPGGGGTATPASAYDFGTATFDAYWYSLYNMSTNIAMSANGVTFPNGPDQKKAFKKRIKGITKHADVDGPPITNPNLNMAPFTAGDPQFTEKPVFEDDTGRPDATTLTWNTSKSSGVVSPSSLAWTHLKGVTWAKNFEDHFDLLPQQMAPKFRAQVLSTMAQLGTKFALVDGNLRKNDENVLLVSKFRPGKGVVDGTPRLRHHSAMLWFLSDLASLAQGGWFGYENPEPLIPAENIQKLTDGMARTTMNALPADGILENTTSRDVGELLGGVGWYGTHAGSDQLRSRAADYANALAGVVESNLAGNGKVEAGAANQAATQGVVAQGLLWASQVDDVDHVATASDVVGYMVDELWDADAGTFRSGTDASTYAITARDAGDITGGLNAADAVLGRSGVRGTFATFFNETFNNGRLQRAERPPSHSEDAQYPLPLPPKAGGEFGQAAVYNAEVEYDADAGEWSVTDPTFRTADALYLANQDIWVGNWGGEFYQGRGVPGQSDQPP